jgi:hypothetical protein
MKTIYLVLIALTLTACNESDSASPFIAESPSAPIDSIIPDPTPTPGPLGACSGDYLVGTWVHTPSAGDLATGRLPQTYVINDDCTAYNTMCEFDFEIAPFGETSGYASGLGWSGSYNLRVSHMNSPNTAKPGCLQFTQVSTPWHDCNLFAVDNDTLEFQCNGPAGFNNGNGTTEPGRVVFERQ